jgi:glycosyltransferase involved in cell wall biosynthesis
MKCGVGDYTASLAKALARRKDTSVAVLTNAAASPIPSEFDFEVFPIAKGWRMGDAIRIARVVRHWRPDIINVQYPTQGYGPRYLPWLLPTMFKMSNLPVVQTWHEYHMERVRRNLLNAALSGGLIAVRPDYEGNMPKWFRWLTGRKRFVFIPNASAIPRKRLTEQERLAIRSRFMSLSTGMVVYFGFVYPHKQVDLLFEISDPACDHLVLICDLNAEDEYHRLILDRVRREPWIGRATVTGFLPSEEVAQILAAADAVVLPFRDGGGTWNTSIHAAVTQRTFVLTTSREKHGYDVSKNIYYARPDDVADMRSALRNHIGSKGAEVDEDPSAEWETIAEAHRAFYGSIL